MNIYKNIAETTGNTPLIKLSRVVKDDSGTVLGKLEFFNPTSSIKDRIGVGMVNAAEKSGELKPGGTIIEPTSGNTGLGLAMVAASRGYKLIITMPETMSIERRSILEHFGATIHLTPGEKGMLGAVEKAEEILTKTENAFMPQQFKNPANPKVHYETTAPEIWADTDGKVDIFVAGVGTGGTLSGCGKFLKEKNPDIKIVAVEPETSAILSGESPGKHGIQGIGAGFIPDILDTDIIDETFKVKDDEALKTASKLAKGEGILCGISSGANVFAAAKIAGRPENKNKTIVTIICDTGERYLTTSLFQN